MMLRSMRWLMCAAFAVAGATALAAQAAEALPKPRADGSGFIVPRAKTSAGIQVSYRLDGVPAAGAEMLLILRLDGIADAAGAQVHLTPGEGLHLAAPRTHQLSPGRTAELRLPLTATRDGAYELVVTSSQGGRAQVMSVPVRVGSAAPRLAKQGQLRQTAAGERVVVLPSR